MKTGIVILSRFSSTRVPGKALKEINGKPLLKYITERLLQIISKDQLVIATSTEVSDDAIEKFASSEGINCYRGSLNNVALRFYEAANQSRWDYAVRINGDNIFVDLPLLKNMMDIARKEKYYFISNVKNRTYPKGMSIEIVKLRHFEVLLPEISRSDHYKEHVTLYLYEHELSEYFFVYNIEFQEAQGLQMALDTYEDFERTEKIINRFQSSHWTYNLKEILSIWNKLKNEKAL